MPTTIETDDGDVVVDTYCPSCGADAVPLLGRECDCELDDGVVCSAVIEYPDLDREPIRTTITDRNGWLDVDPTAVLQAVL